MHNIPFNVGNTAPFLLRSKCTLKLDERSSNGSKEQHLFFGGFVHLIRFYSGDPHYIVFKVVTPTDPVFNVVVPTKVLCYSCVLSSRNKALNQYD